MRKLNVGIVVVLAVFFGIFVLCSSANGHISFFKEGTIPFHIGHADDKGLADGEVTARKIADSAVTGEKIADDVLDVIEDGWMAYEIISRGLEPDNVTFAPGSSTCVVAESTKKGDFINIQSAIDSVSEGGLVYIREGTFEISEGIEIRSSGISLVGSGSGTVLIQKSEDPTIHVGWGAENVIVSNLRIIGNQAKTGIYLTGVRSSKIGDIWVENSEFGIYLKDSTMNIVDRNVIVGNGGGIKLHESHKNLVSGNLLWRNQDYGAYVLSSNANIISGNVARRNNSDGMRVRSGSNNLITGNSCLGNSGAGIYLGYSDTVNNLVATNSCIGNEVGISLTDSVENTGLLVNYFSNNLEGGTQDESDTTRYIGTEDIEDGAITAAKMDQNAVDSNHIMSSAVTTLEIEDHTIGNSDLDENIIEEKNIVDDAITSEKISAGAIGHEHISVGAVGTDEIFDGAVTPEKTNLNVLQTGVEENAVDLNRVFGGFSVSFPYEFSEDPNVIVSFANVDDKTVLPGTLFVENVTTVGFDVGWVLSGQGVGSANVVWHASVEPEEGPIGNQVLENPNFEAPGMEETAPDDWFPSKLYAENENLIKENEFVQYEDYYGVTPKDGDYMGRLRLASIAENGWVSWGGEQMLENFNATAGCYLLYNVAFLNWTGAGFADFAGAVVEVEVNNGGKNYILRYTQGYERKVWPEPSAHIRYIDVLEGEEMPWRGWISVKRNVAKDLIEEFSEIDEGNEFTIRSIRLLSLIHKLGAEKSDVYMGWDSIKLIAVS